MSARACLSVALLAAALVSFSVMAGTARAAEGTQASVAPTSRIDSSGTDSSAPAATAPQAASDTGTYELGPGDKLRLSVFGETDLGGEFEIDGSGYARLPLIGQVKAAGLTMHGLEQRIAQLLSDGYLKDPRVSIEVVNYRPFYIIGEVTKPGQYPYVDGMTALNAIALAGGYTAKADKSEVYIQRGGRQEQEFPSDENTKVRPGDVVRIPERFF